MPIRPENRTRYPTDWKTVIRPAILERAQNQCEGSPAYPDCRAANGEPHPVTGSRVVLTIAHLDHRPETTDPALLRAWCQRCHNTYDAAHRRVTRQRSHRTGTPMLRVSPEQLVFREAHRGSVGLTIPTLSVTVADGRAIARQAPEGDIVLPDGAYLWLNSNDLPTAPGRGLLVLSPAGAWSGEIIALKREAWRQCWLARGGPLPVASTFDAQLRDAVAELEGRLQGARLKLQRQQARVTEQLAILDRVLD